MPYRLSELANDLWPFFAGRISGFSLGGTGGAGSIGEGPGINVAGGGQDVVGFGGDTILQHSSYGNPVAEFEFSASGLATALTTAASGDLLELPAGTLAGIHTMRSGVTLRG